MRVKKKKKVASSKPNILLIVENSEVDFFKQYFNTYLLEEYGVSVKCESSGAGNRCKITNFGKMNKRIERAIAKEGYKAVFLMIDLKTKCFTTETTHTCLVELKREYLPKYQINKELKNKFYLFVVCNEIESWFLTIDKDTNSVHTDHKKELMKFLKVNSEPQIVQKIIKELRSGKYQLDFSKNSSLEYFIEKLQEFN
ncbi:hypothetical protein MNB_SV-13-2068 [hydrothermal vent metagenome]|uniref:DUF4276 family protein n=1 Tax=hydrothermal vent metagenome TaxID=652676 RepID=A0A1W1BYR3_9ZZZZ